MRRRHVLAAGLIAAVALLWLRSAVTERRSPVRSSTAEPAAATHPGDVPAASASTPPTGVDPTDEGPAGKPPMVVVVVPPPPLPAGKLLSRRPGEDAAEAWGREVSRSLTDDERAALDRHLNRFLRGSIPVPGTEPRQPEDSASKIPLLAKADPEGAEQRRLEQLELLQERKAVVLLDPIGKGLAWLALHQGDDGRISNFSAMARCKELGHDPVCCSAGGRGSDDWAATAATGLSILALLDFRDQDSRGILEPTLARAVDWLRRAQRKDGSFPGRDFYATAISVLALAQAAAASGSDELREAAHAGLVYLAARRGPRGGYRYRFQDPGDLSVSAWVAQAVEAARHGGVEVPAEMEQGLRTFLDGVWIEGCRFAYLTGKDERATLAPAGILLGLIEWEVPCPEGSWACSGDDVLESWRGWLVQEPPKGTYSFYYGVRVAIKLAPSMPEAWRGAVLDLAARQKPTGPAAGSFKDELMAGEVVETGFCVLTMEHALYKR